MTPDYEIAYRKMFNTLTDVERKLQQLINLVRTAQIQCEEMIIRAGGGEDYDGDA